MMGSILEGTLDVGRVKALLGILKLSDEEAYDHSMDVAKIVERYLQIEEANGIIRRNRAEQQSIVTGALLHDIGKAFLPFGLQYSSRQFTEAETEIMNTHPILGTVAIKNCEFDRITNNIILMHHANADGTGYPRLQDRVLSSEPDEGLKKEEKEDRSCIYVPEYVWIVAYADKLDAMISRRKFKPQKDLKETWETLIGLKEQKKLPYGPLGIYRTIIQDMDIFKGDGDENKFILPSDGERE